jgi:uncharacterized protein YjiK
MKLSIPKAMATVAAISVGGFGGYTIYDRIPEVDPVPTNGPLSALPMLDGSSTPFGAAVRNPAGITWMADSETYLVSTDDRVIAEVSADFGTVISQMTLPSAPLGTGDTEGVAYLGNNRAAAIGERGVVIILDRSATGWKESERFAIKGMVAGTQLGSGAYDPQTNTLFTAQKSGEKRLYRINLDTQDTDVIDMTLASDLAVAAGRDWSEFTIAGLGFVDGQLLANSEAFSSVLTIQPSGEVSAVHGISNINEAAGLTIRDDQIVLVGGAESYLPIPPIYFVARDGQI